MYGILSVVGWAWTAVVAAYVVVRLRELNRKEPRGFEPTITGTTIEKTTTPDATAVHHEKHP